MEDLNEVIACYIVILALSVVAAFAVKENARYQEGLALSAQLETKRIEVQQDADSWQCCLPYPPSQHVQTRSF